MYENRSIKPLKNPLYFVLCQIVWNFFFILGSIIVAASFFYILKTFDFLNLNVHKYEVSSEIVYVGKNKEVFDRAYSGIKYSKTINNQNFVLVDDGYSFIDIENYHKVCSYGDKIVLATQYIPINTTLEVSKVLNPNMHTWSAMGYKYADFDEYLHVCAPYNQSLVSEYVAINTPNHERTGKVSYMQGNLKPNGINIMLKTDLDMTNGYYELPTNEFMPTYVKFDLYARNDIDPDIMPPEIKGMDVLENTEYTIISSNSSYSMWKDIFFYSLLAFIPGRLIFMLLVESYYADKRHLKKLEERKKHRNR